MKNIKKSMTIYCIVMPSKINLLKFVGHKRPPTNAAPPMTAEMAMLMG